MSSGAMTRGAGFWRIGAYATATPILKLRKRNDERILWESEGKMGIPLACYRTVLCVAPFLQQKPSGTVAKTKIRDKKKVQ